MRHTIGGVCYGTDDQSRIGRFLFIPRGGTLCPPATGARKGGDYSGCFCLRCWCSHYFHMSHGTRVTQLVPRPQISLCPSVLGVINRLVPFRRFACRSSSTKKESGWSCLMKRTRFWEMMFLKTSSLNWWKRYDQLIAPLPPPTHQKDNVISLKVEYNLRQNCWHKSPFLRAMLILSRAQSSLCFKLPVEPGKRSLQHCSGGGGGGQHRSGGRCD